MADYATQELWDLAIEWGLKGIELAEENHNEKALTALLINTGIIYVKLKKYQKSKEMIDQVNRIAYPLTSSDKATKYTVEALSELGLGQEKKAMRHIEKAYELGQLTNSLELPEILTSRGKIYTKLGQLDLAEKSFVKGLELATKNNQSKDIINIMIEWAELDVSQEAYLQAVEKLLKAMDQINQAQARKELKDIYFNLSKCYKALGQSDKSLVYFRERRRRKGRFRLYSYVRRYL